MSLNPAMARERVIDRAVLSCVWNGLRRRLYIFRHLTQPKSTWQVPKLKVPEGTTYEEIGESLQRLSKARRIHYFYYPTGWYPLERNGKFYNCPHRDHWGARMKA